jgi:hypothetical protein
MTSAIVCLGLAGIVADPAHVRRGAHALAVEHRLDVEQIVDDLLSRR